MLSKEKNFKGFTLVEVLIVVVIIAILAALILPRMTTQINRAEYAEAIQMLGAIRRAGERQHDLTGSYSTSSGWLISDPNNIFEGWGGGSHPERFEELGLKGIENSKKWAYSYLPGDNFFWAEADNVKGGWMYYADGGWYCDDEFYTNNNVPTVPCTVI